MQLFWCFCILILSIAVFYVLGKAVCIRCCWPLAAPEIVCVGFFFYFAAFQVIAEVMIFTKSRLHVLKNVWIVILILLLAVAVMIIRNEFKRHNKSSVYEDQEQGIQTQFGINGLSGVYRNQPDTVTRLLMALMAAAILCECASAVLMQRNIGWDFAYYIGNMTTSVATDTMYLYDGSSGLLRNELELRYALSSFYMNTAWISQLTGISALVLQKYVMGILCVLLTNAVVYSFAMEVFGKERKKAAVLVTITILLTIFWDVYDTSAQFLMLRNYEAKAYCANVVLPMILFLLYRIWKSGGKNEGFGELFLVSFASVAVSMSSLVIVPAMIVIMMLAHLLVEKKWNTAIIFRIFCCMLPNVCYMVVYFLSTRGWLVVEV